MPLFQAAVCIVVDTELLNLNGTIETEAHGT